MFRTNNIDFRITCKVNANTLNKSKRANFGKLLSMQKQRKISIKSYNPWLYADWQ